MGKYISEEYENPEDNNNNNRDHRVSMNRDKDDIKQRHDKSKSIEDLVDYAIEDAETLKIIRDRLKNTSKKNSKTVTKKGKTITGKHRKHISSVLSNRSKTHPSPDKPTRKSLKENHVDSSNILNISMAKRCQEAENGIEMDIRK